MVVFALLPAALTVCDWLARAAFTAAVTDEELLGV
jgi:hypothetical protein